MPKSHGSVLLAVVALPLLLIAQAAEDLAHWQQVRDGLPGGVFALLAVLLVLAALPSARQILRRDPQLLVPWALGTAAAWVVTAVLGRLLGSWFTATLEWRPFGLGLGLSVALVLQMAIDVLLMAWAGAATLAVARGATAGAALTPTLVLARQRFWRVAGGYLLGHGVVLLVVTAIILSADFSPVMAVLLVGFAIAWNLLTATLLLHLVAESSPFFVCCQRAFASARASLGFLAPWKLLQLGLLGLLVVVSHSAPGRHRTHWAVHASWTGGYPTQSHWAEDYRGLVEAAPSDLLRTLLALALFLLALVVQLRAARVVWGQLDPLRSDLAAV